MLRLLSQLCHEPALTHRVAATQKGLTCLLDGTGESGCKVFVKDADEDRVAAVHRLLNIVWLLRKQGDAHYRHTVVDRLSHRSDKVCHLWTLLRGALIVRNPSMSWGVPHLHERIRAALSHKHLGLRVAQHIVLRAPLDDLDVAADL